MSAKQFYKIATPGVGEVIANGVLQMYGSIFRGVSDGCYLKDSKVGGRKYAILQTALSLGTAASSPGSPSPPNDTRSNQQEQTSA